MLIEYREPFAIRAKRALSVVGQSAAYAGAVGYASKYPDRVYKFARTLAPYANKGLGLVQEGQRKITRYYKKAGQTSYKKLKIIKSKVADDHPLLSKPKEPYSKRYNGKLPLNMPFRKRYRNKKRSSYRRGYKKRRTARRRRSMVPFTPREVAQPMLVSQRFHWSVPVGIKGNFVIHIFPRVQLDTIIDHAAEYTKTLANSVTDAQRVLVKNCWCKFTIRNATNTDSVVQVDYFKFKVDATLDPVQVATNNLSEKTGLGAFGSRAHVEAIDYDWTKGNGLGRLFKQRKMKTLHFAAGETKSFTIRTPNFTINKQQWNDTGLVANYIKNQTYCVVFRHQGNPTHEVGDDTLLNSELGEFDILRTFGLSYVPLITSSQSSSYAMTGLTAIANPETVTNTAVTAVQG